MYITLTELPEISAIHKPQKGFFPKWGMNTLVFHGTLTHWRVARTSPETFRRKHKMWVKLPCSIGTPFEVWYVFVYQVFHRKVNQPLMEHNGSSLHFRQCKSGFNTGAQSWGSIPYNGGRRSRRWLFVLSIKPAKPELLQTCNVKHRIWNIAPHPSFLPTTVSPKDTDFAGNLIFVFQIGQSCYLALNYSLH